MTSDGLVVVGVIRKVVFDNLEVLALPDKLLVAFAKRTLVLRPTLFEFFVECLCFIVAIRFCNA